MATRYVSSPDLASLVLAGLIVATPSDPSLIQFLLAAFRRLSRAAYSRFF